MATEVIQRKFAEVRRKETIVSSLTGFCFAVVGLVALIGAGMLADFLFELPFVARAGILAVAGAGVLALAWKYVLSPLLFAEDDEEIALRVERQTPTFQTRLISAVQFARPDALGLGVSRSMVLRLIGEAEEMAGSVDFSRVVKTNLLTRALIAATGFVVVATAGLAVGGEVMHDLFKRAMLVDVPVPRETRVIDTTPERVACRGDSVRLTARAEGVIPADGKLRLTFASGRSQRFDVKPDPAEPSTFVATIENVQETFTYRFYLNDGHSKDAELLIVPRPAVQSLTAIQHYPAFTRQKPAPVQPGDLRLLEGSRLELQIVANKAVRPNPPPGSKVTNRIRLLGDQAKGFPRELPLRVSVNDMTRLSAIEGAGPGVAVPAGVTGLQVWLVDDYGKETKDPPVYRVEVVPIEKPKLKIIEPTLKEQLVTAVAKVAVEWTASQEFGIRAAKLKYKVDRLDGGAERSVDLPMEIRSGGGDQPAREVRGRLDLDIARLGAPEESSIEWWIEVSDNREPADPKSADARAGVTASERYVLKIVSESKKREELMKRLGESINEITDVERTQTDLKDKMRGIVEDKRPPVEEKKPPTGP